MTAAILIAVLLLFAARILFAIESLLCKLIDILFETFQVFAGIKTVIYDGGRDYLINVFFQNDVVNAVYWGMACIGIAMTFGFAIAAVVRKIFDYSGEKVKATYGQILINVGKAILLILLMTAIVSATINATGVLMQSVDTLFNNAEEYAHPSTIYFTDEDFGTMFRIMNTVGNYCLNPAFDNRFNLNSCFNEIRNDMQILDSAGTFNFPYEGAEDSWQYALLQIYNSGDIYEELPIDSYNDAIIDAMENCIYQIKTNKNFKPLEEYKMEYSLANLGTTLGRTVMLTASFESAKNSKYNENASVLDALRRPYYVGTKDIYDHGVVEDDFDIGLFSWNHLICLVVAFFLIKEMAIILLNCVARIFNIILLYVTAPGFIAVMPLDDGGKFKQWTTAFVIQSLSIFGSVFAVRLLMIFIPIVLSPSLVIFTNNLGNAIAKLILVVGICVTSEKANGMISGILADNAGYQSIMAGDVGSGLVNKGLDIAGKVGMAAASAGFKLGQGVLSGAATATGLDTVGNKIGEKAKNLGQSMKDKGGIVGAAMSGWTTNEQDQKEQESAEKEADKADTQDFRNFIADSLNSLVGKGGGVNNPGPEKPKQGFQGSMSDLMKPAQTPPPQHNLSGPSNNEGESENQPTE